jgi:hypothetical protein
MITLPVITAKELPRTAYAHGKDHDVKLTLLENFRPVVNSSWGVKPEAGGMWTAPVTDACYTGEIVSTAWLDWCRSEMPEWLTRYNLFQEIVPQEDFRGLRIDTLADMRAVAEAYPGPRDARMASYLRWGVLDWEHMAADGFDAVYLTDDGQWETRMPEDSNYSLYGWDCASVLWLRPNYWVEL